MRISTEHFEITKVYTKQAVFAGWNSYSISRLRMSLWLFTADVTGSATAVLTTVLLMALLKFEVSFAQSLGYSPIILTLPVIFMLDGAYPGVGTGPVEEIQRLFTRITLVFGVLLLITLQREDSALHVLSFLIISWLLSLGFLILSRWIFRGIAISMNAWGEPIAIIGTTSSVQRVNLHLKQNRALGFIPKFLITDPPTLPYSDDKDNFTIKRREYSEFIEKFEVEPPQTAILALWDIEENRQQEIIDWSRSHFQRLYVTAVPWRSELKTAPLSAEGLVGVELVHKLGNPLNQLSKRLIDVLLVIISLPIALPLLALIAIAVRLDSRGTSFYKHERIGKDGRTFHVWKVRTMVVDADEVLKEYLAKHPGLLQEWNENHKLKQDPRITRLGQFLRRSSLDELPQIFNILKGDMSVVGPRPIVNSEIIYYGNVFELYMLVKPGLTGIWQVSGRNNTDYKTRVRLDEYYVRNWTIWLDIYILFRTVWVVVKQHGAY